MIKSALAMARTFPGLSQTMLLRARALACGAASSSRRPRSPRPAAGRRRRATPRSRGSWTRRGRRRRTGSAPPSGRRCTPAPRAAPGPGVDSRLGLDRARLEVDARRLDRLGGLHPVGDQADDRLQDRGADPVRAAAAEPQPRARPRAGPRSATSSRAPGARRAVVWKPSGFRSSSPSMLLTWTPVPGTIRPEPVPFEQVTLAQRPSPSTAVMWVVEPRPSPGPTTPPAGRAKARPGALGGRVEARRVRNCSSQPSSVEPGEELLGAGGLRLLHHRHDLLDPGGAEPLEQVEARRRSGCRPRTAAGW